MLERQRLALIGGWYSTALLARDAEAEIAALQPHLALLKALGSSVFIAAEISNAIHGDRGRAAQPDAAARLPADWPPVRRAPGRGRRSRRGSRAAGSPTTSTWERSSSGSRRWTASSPTRRRTSASSSTPATPRSAASMPSPDPRPSRAGGPRARQGRAPAGLRAGPRASRASFLDGVLAGMFTAPGDGDLDLRRSCAALADIGYAGWIVIEAEQDPALADPRVYGRLGLEDAEGGGGRPPA